MRPENSFEHGISTRDLAIIEKVLAPFADRITKIGIFGSRSTARFRANSDIDLVLRGALTPRDILRVATEFEESSLSLPVDVVHYDAAPAELRAHIDACEKPLLF